MDRRLSAIPDNPGPRPQIKLLGLAHGVPLFHCESAAEMIVRLEGLRKPGDMRAAERILGALDSYRNRKDFRRNDSKNE